MTDRLLQNARRDTLSGEINNTALSELPHTGFLPSSTPYDPLYLVEVPLGMENESATAINSSSDITQVPTEKGPDHSFDSSYWDVCMATEFNDFETLGASDGLDAFSGFDIPFWFDQGQHWDFSQ